MMLNQKKGDSVIYKETLEKIKELNEGFPLTRSVKEWKDRGARVIGWSCNYVPEELIHAAGMLPVRVTGDRKEPDLIEADNYLHIHSCTFSRCLFERTLAGQFDFLDGYVSCSTCDGMRRLADVWQHYLKVPFTYIIDVPWNLTERARLFYLKELQELNKILEERFRVKITDEGLRESIKTYNQTRRLLQGLNELRKEVNPPLSGAEILEIQNAAARTPKEEFNRLLGTLLKEVPHSPGESSEKIRLMLNGSILNNVEFVQGIESMGAVAVTDGICSGTRYSWGWVDSDSLSPEEALSKFYFYKFPCPRMSPNEERYDLLLKLVKEYRVEGVISEIIRFCAPHLYDQFRFRKRLEAEGIPILELDVEYGMGLSGGIKTRVEAFVEMLHERRKRS